MASRALGEHQCAGKIEGWEKEGWKWPLGILRVSVGELFCFFGLNTRERNLDIFVRSSSVQAK